VLAGTQAVGLAAELAQDEQQRGLNGPRGEDRLLIRIQLERRAGRGTEKQRLKDRANSRFQRAHPPRIAADAHLVERDREGLCSTNVRSAAVLLDRILDLESLTRPLGYHVLGALGIRAAAEDTRRRGSFLGHNGV
jgi:hypothetical protein